MAKKKSINLSDLLKNYSIKDDVTQNPNKYVIGGQLHAPQGGYQGVQGAPLAGASSGSGGPGVGAYAAGANMALDMIPSDAGKTTINAQGVAQQEGLDTGDYMKGVGQGAASGAATGAAFGPWGAAIGGVVGGVGGFFSSKSQDNAIDANNAAQKQQQAQMANGGELTQYNGNTHANGGIPIGQGAEVEDKETRWEDYIFSERLKIPGKKYSFADASKKIEAKYSKRKNDSYDKKAKEREMKSLMAMQESERERMDLDHQNKMKETFAAGGDMKYPDGGELPINPDGTSNINPLSWNQVAATPNAAPNAPMVQGSQPGTPTQLNEKDVAAAYAAQGNTSPTSIGMSGNYGNDINVTPQDTVTATDIQSGQIGNYAPTAGMAQIQKWGNQVTKNIPDRQGIDGNVIPGGIQVPSAMANRRAENNKYLSMFQKNTIQRAADAYAAQGEGYEAYKGFVPGQPLPDDVALSPEQLAALYSDKPEKLGKYHNLMEEQFAINDILGISNDGFFGPKELAREGEGLKYKVREQMWGPRHANYDWSNPERQVNYAKDRVTNPGVRAYGGEINPSTGRVMAEYGLTPEQLLLASRAASAKNESTPQQFANLNNLSINVPNQQGFGTSEGGFGEMGQGFQSGLNIPNIASQINNNTNGGLANENDYNVGVPEKKGTGLRDLGVLLGQNLGNINNIIQGAKGAEQVELGSINPAKVSYKAAIANANSAYDSAANIARENIRKNATSSGQALSNLIAQNTSLTKDRAAQIASINERQQNTNAQAQAQADQTNLQMRAREEDLNQRGDAASQQAMAAGLTGIGSSIAGFNKDAKANKMQDQYIQNLLNTGQYAIDPKTKQIIFLGNKTV